ncbi:MAG: ABC transporter substrate-binding protein [Nitrososphaerota archaeon]|nr:ABC transporter substrate-binding protein [Nitrososphaerota archaeon]MDG6969388.1 ABC transporter substrate-binding protein [Nitrososphaerota archaeon]MDG6973008.1 ABC transporter substrate-binding protein [Nitrososphaerota archaeon]MDG6982642.1 ABC transporter substrate-binding protein [Nitrososphaerota archaeon]MDG6987301.1 ABC transporter substrate-binding protein [Nitrososphaerota archaeon]
MRNRHSGIARVVVAVIVVVILVVAGAAYFFVVLPPSHTSSTTSAVQAPASVTVDEIPAPVSVDPASSYDVPGGEIMQNVYQGLVFYNGRSGSSFVGVLAENWSVSSNGLNYTFNLWPSESFSNGTPLNASTIWYSFYRTMILNLGISSYVSQVLAINGGGGFTGNVTATTKGNIRLPFGAEQALAAGGYTFSSNQLKADQQASEDLASILSHFNAANSTIGTIMSYSNQAVSVSGTDQVKINLDFPYADFLQVISGGLGDAVSPVFVDANGGVQIDTANSYTTKNALGSGPYTLTTPLGGSNVVLVANSNYWASQIPASQRSVWLTPPAIKTVVIDYQSSEATRVADIQSGHAQISQVEIPDLHEVTNYSGVTIYNWGPTPTIDFLAIDAYQYPYNITGVRMALEYGVNPTQIQQQVYSGYSQPYVGPLDPAMAYYNPSIPGYAYNANTAIQQLSQAGFKVSLPNGTVINSGGRTLPALNLIYTAGSAADQEEATVIQSQLAAIGVTVNLAPEAFTTIIEDMLNPATSSNYPAFQIAANSVVFVGPSDPSAYLGNCPARCHHGDPAYFNNTQVVQLINEAIHTSNPTLLQQYYNNMTNIYKQQAQYVWLDDFTAYTVSSSSLHGFAWNAALLGTFYATLY